MKKNILFILTALMFTSSQAQWVKHGIGANAPGVCIVDLSMPSDNVVWGILSVFSAGTCGGVVPYYVRSTNGSNFITNPVPLPADVTPVCISAINSVTAWIAAGNIASNTTGYIYKTTNGGGSWVQQSSAVFNDAVRFVHFFDVNEGVAVGDSSVFVTIDGGNNWIARPGLPVPASVIGSGRTIFLLNSYEVLGNTIWLGDTYGYFYKSTDKGNSWSQMPYPIAPSAIKGIAFRDSLYGIAVASQWISGGGNGGGGYADYSVFTSDGGLSWQPLVINFPSASVVNSVAKYDVAYVPGSANTFVVTSEYDASYAAFSAVTYDGGTTWALIDSTEQHTACVFSSENKGYTGGYVNNFQSGVFSWNGVLSSIVNLSDEVNEVFTLSPLPATDLVTLKRNNESLIRDISVIDISGKRITSFEVDSRNDKEIILDVSSLPRGIYMILLSEQNGNIYSQKLIK